VTGFCCCLGGESVALRRRAAAIARPGGIGRGADLNDDVVARPEVAARFADRDFEGGLLGEITHAGGFLVPAQRPLVAVTRDPVGDRRHPNSPGTPEGSKQCRERAGRSGRRQDFLFGAVLKQKGRNHRAPAAFPTLTTDSSCAFLFVAVTSYEPEPLST